MDYFSQKKIKNQANLSVGQTSQIQELLNSQTSPSQFKTKILKTQRVEGKVFRQPNIQNENKFYSSRFNFNQRKFSEGFDSSRLYQNSPNKLFQQNNVKQTMKTHSSKMFLQDISKQQMHSTQREQNDISSPKSIFSYISNQENNQKAQQKINSKIVKQLRDAIKRTKQNQMEEQLNLDEQKQLEKKIKKELLPQILKIQEQSMESEDKVVNNYIQQTTSGVKARKKKQFNSFDLQKQFSLNEDDSKIAKNIKNQKQNLNIELLMILKFIQNRQEYLQTLKYMNKDQAIDKLCDLLKLATELDDTDLFLDVMDMIVQTCIMFSDYRLALIFLSTIKSTCELTHNVVKKITLHRNYSQVCKKLGFYEESLRFLKKALQYIWLVDDKDQEVQLYDDLGLVFFHLVQLDKAKTFHEKSVQSFNEPIDNILREMSSRNIQKFLNSFPLSKNLDNTVLLKLNYFPFKILKRDLIDGNIEPHIENNYLKKNNLKLVKNLSHLNSGLSEIYLIQQVLLSNEFFNEISTPLSKPLEFSPLEFVRMKKVNDHFVCIEEKEIKKGKAEPKFIFPKQFKKTNNTTFYLDEDKKKMDLEDKIKFRMKQLDQDMRKKNKIQTASAESVIIRKENLEAINIGHLTTNRNAEAFTQAVCINYQLPNKFYDKMISIQYNKHNNQFNSQNVS
ncbi:hypothetical protein ABPG74_005936 [Tetrahymena malaccensis]